MKLPTATKLSTQDTAIASGSAGARLPIALEQHLRDSEYHKLYSMRQKLSPDHQQQFDLLTPRQLRQLAALADERPDGIDWAAQQFHWICPELVKYIR